MSKNWLWLIVATSAVYLHFGSTLAATTSSIDGAGDPLSQDLALDIGRQSISTTSNGEGSGMQRTVGTDLGDTLLGVFRAPLFLVRRIAALPLFFVGMVTDWGKEAMANLTEAAIVEGWQVAKDYVIPWLDEMSVKAASYEYVPEQIRSMLTSMHSVYIFLKMFGYMKPM